MPKLVFDIETSGLPVVSFDAVQQAYLEVLEGRVPPNRAHVLSI